jgi:hypothetical protein
MKLRDRTIRKMRREFSKYFKGNVVQTKFPKVIQMDTHNHCGKPYWESIVFTVVLNGR